MDMWIMVQLTCLLWYSHFHVLKRGFSDTSSSFEDLSNKSHHN